MTEKRPVEAFHDRDAPTYDQRYDENLFFVKVYEPVTWDNIQRFLPPSGGRILDAGGGTGRWAVPLARMGYQITLTDISARMLEVAQRKLEAEGLLDRVTIQWMDICDMRDLPDDHFDLAMAQGDPLSYCNDPDRAVAELARVTRPGGYVIGSVDSRIQAVGAMGGGNWELAERMLATGGARWQNEDPALAFPIHTFTVGELQELFEKHGLRVVRVVGKPAFFQRLSPEAQERVLEDEEALARLLDLEIRYADDPGWAGSAGHFEMVGIKE
jgi:ubiquinone/menaquinone biosynthesis C-methylase UbiE